MHEQPAVQEQYWPRDFDIRERYAEQRELLSAPKDDERPVTDKREEPRPGVAIR